ncbi:hepatitis A virus cellular receptor 1 homolog isoform X2 [Rhinatrema bivittatum]|uniref:hepatitis A virus cellular receptor 1 homolog isoform X2 n=1 Tax=Rhinatrema bivittatum TaxID=194408 RepID=UPI00112AA1C6|nr:hepatitis A virus cellular receptor 1 homolog isoform X2 [Rhinatrema bivittatum]
MSASCFFQMCVPVLLLTGSPVSGLEVRGLAGQSLTLPCNYTVANKEMSTVCWGRKVCPISGCNDEILRMDGRRITSLKGSRYQFHGNLSEGNVSLTIEDISEADSGEYCCRVEIPGWFNDLKQSYVLIIDRAPNKNSTPDPGKKTCEHCTGAGDFISTSPTVSPWRISDPGQNSLNPHVILESSHPPPAQSQRLNVALFLCVAGLLVLLPLNLLFLRRCNKKKEKTEEKASPLFALNRESEHISALQAGNQTEDNIYIME